jgi:large subunit ribosomal protein L6
MSRIGNLPVQIPEKVEVDVNNNNEVSVKGPLGELHQTIRPEIQVKINDGEVVLDRTSEKKEVKSLHGLYRALIGNMVEGVSKGFQIQLELVGVGFRAEAKGQNLELSLGYSHEIVFQIPSEVKVETVTERRSNPKITLTSHNKQLVGLIASKIRSLRKPEPYKGKGVKYVDEYIRRKAGKAGA